MKSDNPLPGIFVFTLAFTGGFADASSFILLGVFSGHLTGNSVLSLIQLISGDYAALSVSVTALAGFIAGTVAGIVWRRHIRRERNRYLLMIPQFILIAACAVLWKTMGGTQPGNWFFAAGLSFALGIQNGGFSRLFGSPVHTTYITGTTTSLLLSLLETDRPDVAAVRDRRIHAVIPCAFVLGAGGGALMTYHFHLGGFLALIPIVLFSALLCRKCAAQEG